MDKSTSVLTSAALVCQAGSRTAGTLGTLERLGRVTRSEGDDRRLIRRSGVLLAVSAALATAVAAVGVRAAAGAALRDAGLAAGGAVGLALLFVLAAVIVATRYREHVRSTEAASSTQDRLRQATIAVLFASAALVPLALLLLRRPSTSNPANEYPVATPSHGAEPTQAFVPPPTHPPSKGHGFSFNLTAFLLVLSIVVGVLLLAALIALAVSLLRKVPDVASGTSAPPIAQSQAEDEALADALLAGRSALAGDDARAAIIACYAAMETSLEQMGVVRERSDSPSDLLSRAMRRDLPGMGTQNAATLTNLFREARFSTHPMTTQQLDAARSALDAVTIALAERMQNSTTPVAAP
jgi:hypothetical protein